MSAFLTYLWPSACPVCNARLGTLDRLSLQARRLGALATLSKGKLPGRQTDPRRCDWCHNPTGARRATS